MTGKTTAELFLGRKLIIPFQKLVMVPDGTEFAPDGHGYELVSSVRALVPQKFSVEEELMHVQHVEVKSPHVGVMWKFEGELSAQVRIYRHRKCDETQIRTGISDSNSLRNQSSGFDRIERRSDKSQFDRKKRSGVKRELEEKGLSFLRMIRTKRWKISGVLTSHGQEDPVRSVGPVRSRKGRERNDNPYIKERTRSGYRNAIRRGDQQREEQKRKEASTR
ncbi:hypothetical protein TNCV_3685521 [Trichonephila clavipes]|nr:hypothetical protein TNCV_3685521 [Trichonephila clavipes]